MSRLNIDGIIGYDCKQSCKTGKAIKPEDETPLERARRAVFHPDTYKQNRNKFRVTYYDSFGIHHEDEVDKKVNKERAKKLKKEQITPLKKSGVRRIIPPTP